MGVDGFVCVCGGVVYVSFLFSSSSPPPPASLSLPPSLAPNPFHLLIRVQVNFGLHSFIEQLEELTQNLLVTDPLHPNLR